MPSRSQRSSQERQARSAAVQHVADKPLLRGSLVVMHRRCGKPGCHCQQGEKHPALYLAVRAKNKRAMIYIPPALEETVREWIVNGRRVDELLDFVSQQCLAQLLDQKQQVLGRSPQASVRRKRRRKGRAP
jgi:Family of unknown function (DUF6788)